MFNLKSIFQISLLGFSIFLINPSIVEATNPSLNLKAVASDDVMEIEDSAPATDLELKGVDGENYSLDAIKGENGLLVIFSCNTCPYVLAWEDRYKNVYEKCQEQGIGMIVVNSNAMKRGKGESYEDMQEHAKEVEYTFPYVIDSKQTLVKAFKANKTPDCYLFDADLKLKYKGAIDDNMYIAQKVEKAYLQEAIDKMIQGKVIDPSTTKALGCRIRKMM